MLRDADGMRGKHWSGAPVRSAGGAGNDRPTDLRQIIVSGSKKGAVNTRGLRFKLDWTQQSEYTLEHSFIYA